MTSWEPSCSIELLKKRAKLLMDIRSFFYARDIMEVETPLLSSSIGTDPGLEFFSSEFQFPPEKRKMFLQTSPEFAMKRLLAAGSGSIFQICKAFRNGEKGRCHNPEFTMLEWYRIDYDLRMLMDEVAELLQFLFGINDFELDFEILSYSDAFFKYAGIDPINAEQKDFAKCALEYNLSDAELICGKEKSLWLDFLFSHLIQPKLGHGSISIIYHFPSSQSSLARRHLENPELAERFEVFINGMELANGYHELSDADEQLHRFETEQINRKEKGLIVPKIDQRLLAALKAGLPDCSGVAIGIDRLLMILTGQTEIDKVLSFSIHKA